VELKDHLMWWDEEMAAVVVDHTECTLAARSH
jgi:hypothetical protein